MAKTLTAPDNLLDILTAKLQGWRQEREQVAAQLREAEQTAKPIDAKAEAARLARNAWQLHDELQTAEPARARELLQRAVQRIELSFAEHYNGKRKEYRPSGGRAVFQAGPELSGFARRRDRRPIELFADGVTKIEPALRPAVVATAVVFSGCCSGR